MLTPARPEVASVCTGAVGAAAMEPKRRMLMPVLLPSAKSAPQTPSWREKNLNSLSSKSFPVFGSCMGTAAGWQWVQLSTVPGMLCLSALLQHLPRHLPSHAAHEMTKNSKCRGSWHGASVTSHTSHSIFSIASPVLCIYLLSLFCCDFWLVWTLPSPAQNASYILVCN